jgi:hypothetical protein
MYFTHTMMNFDLQVLPDSQLGSHPSDLYSAHLRKESLRVLQPGGTFTFATWINPGWLDTSNAAVPGFHMPASTKEKKHHPTCPRLREAIYTLRTPIR